VRADAAALPDLIFWQAGRCGLMVPVILFRVSASCSCCRRVVFTVSAGSGHTRAWGVMLLIILRVPVRRRRPRVRMPTRNTAVSSPPVLTTDCIPAVIKVGSDKGFLRKHQAYRRRGMIGA
jgi:hypothetical protein